MVRRQAWCADKRDGWASVMVEPTSRDRANVLVERWLDQLISLIPALERPDAPLTPLEAKQLIAWADQHDVPTHVLSRSLAETIGAAWLDSLSGVSISADFIQQVPIHLARRFRMIGLAADTGPLPVVVCDLEGLEELDVVGRFLRRDVIPKLSSPGEIDAAINVAYQQKTGEAQQVIESFEAVASLAELEQDLQREDLLDVAGRAPIIKLVNSILFDAVKTRASDVHMQPFEDRMVIRFRIDGVLFDQFTVPHRAQEEVVSRIKVVGKMNIAEKRLPQDGRATVQVGDRIIDLRIASMPTSHGEKVVIRLLDKSARLYTLSEIGMSKSILEVFRKLIHVEHGLVLVTGPTGGGKSTTLYAALQEINTKNFNVVTLEDPIEYQLDGISQTQVNEKKGMTFASGLRSVLRQDPDIIMIGEIRDRPTAEMAIQSALTGHLVFSTLHTNDASSAVTRLLDLGIEPYLVASSLIGVLAQRLVRRVCDHCKSKFDATDILQQLDPEIDAPCVAYVGSGCKACRKTGYHGRLGLFELMVSNEAIRDLIQKRANASEIRSAAVEQSMRLLRHDGLDKVRDGLTTIEEVARVSMQSFVK